MNAERLELMDLSPNIGTSLLIYGKKEINNLPLTNIMYVAACDHYSIFHTKGGRQYVSSKTLRHYMELLAAEGFIRVSRFFLVNKSHIDSYRLSDRMITLKNKETLQVSFRKERFFVEAMYGNYEKLKAV